MIKFYIVWKRYPSTWGFRIKKVNEKVNAHRYTYYSIRLGPVWIKWYVNDVI